jgi:hypothetical protein
MNKTLHPNLNWLVALVNKSIFEIDQDQIQELDPLGKFSLSINTGAFKDYLLLRFDEGSKLYPFLQEQKGYNQMCDYLLIVPRKDNTLDVVLIELKGNDSAQAQLKAGRRLMDFLIQQAIAHQLITPSLKVRYIHVKVKNPSGSKRPMRNQFKLDFNAGLFTHHFSKFRLDEILLDERWTEGSIESEHNTFSSIFSDKILKPTARAER